MPYFASMYTRLSTSQSYGLKEGRDTRWLKQQFTLTKFIILTAYI